MPLIQVMLLEGVFDADEKQAIIEGLTDAMVSVEGKPCGPSPGSPSNRSPCR